VKRKAKADDGLNWVERQVLKLVINKLIKKIQNMALLKGSWVSSLMGWLKLAAAVSVAAIALIDADPTTKPDANAVLIAMTAVGLAVPGWIHGLVTRDKGVSTESQRRAGTTVK
jgi:hypothetical protein